MERNYFVTILLAAVLALSLTFFSTACGDDDDDDDDGATGTLEFYANGEEFIRDGFVGKTGWDIGFTHFYVNVYGPTAFQVAENENEAQTFSPAHAGHPHEDIPEGAAHVALEGEYWLDLHEGDDRQLVDTVEDAPIGNYNYANFALTQVEGGEWNGYSIVMIGNATHIESDETVAFTIKLTEQMLFSSCHQEVDDEYAGVVDEDGAGSMELTFHSDHLFGDYDELGNPDSVNPIALGFQPFADLAADGELDIDQAQMEAAMSADDYATFIAALHTLGHSGEGHCNYEEYSEGE